MDRSKMEQGIRTFLDGLGPETAGEDLEAAPERVVRAWAEDLVAGYDEDPRELLTWTPAPASGGTVVVRDIGFASVCVHHLLPFFGFAHVAYLPDRRLAGLSKIGRVVEAHGRRLQLQERLNAEIVQTLQTVLEPHGAVVMLEAEHTCMTLRGSKKVRSRMQTVNASGIFERDDLARREVMDLLLSGGGRRSGS